ncbi:hypothetical protein PICMEDRAFT_68347 [Pichia membranifaciens NRRL Y-2026]|uniref:Protein transport protein SFT2 n=1 Tax=Pichia membranifaciens NRRL Y-2026 TaxID=763406 RepID=A0A1E3NLH8_9ASCO|nr:hypothetical protein PICMEDRAFT_68347 [Pichia membranifaciens NRRL Y-2026]ODQ47002.1 hypothetical protein PICMEDRAFT_68347 [Pichia membranifaciens NRRL Y-2026]
MDFFTSRFSGSNAGPVHLQDDNATVANNNNASDDTDSILKLSYFERISLFIVCILGCYACYAICFIFFPVLSLKPKKFSLIWTIGSVLFLVAFAILNGPTNFFKHAISVERLPFTLSFVGSIVTTLLFSLVWKNNLLVIISCVIQAICSVYYTVSYFPYGRQGLRLTTGVARSQVENWLSV